MFDRVTIQEGDRQQTESKHEDITTFRQNRSNGRFSENVSRADNFIKIGSSLLEQLGHEGIAKILKEDYYSNNQCSFQNRQRNLTDYRPFPMQLHY